MVDRSRRCSWLTAADSFFPIGLFLIYQDSMLSYLINNGELYSTYKGGTPSTRGRSSNWKGMGIYIVCHSVSIGHGLLTPL